MNNLGSKLRDARIEKGYTLNTLQQMTKIQKKYLQAIEEGNYEDMPGNFYVRAFIKQYADVVDLNGDELLDEYENELNLNNEDDFESYPSQDDEEDYPSRVKRTGSDQKGTFEVFLSYVPLILLIAIIIIIMVTLVMAINRIGEVEEEQTQVTSQESNQIVSLVEPNSEVSSEAESGAVEEGTSTPELGEDQVLVGDQVITSLGVDGTTAIYQLENPIEEYEFEAEALSYVWIGVTEDDVMVVDNSINEGESVTYEAEPSVSSLQLSRGYPEGATFFVNGTELELPETYIDSVLFVTSDESSESGIDEPAESVPETEAPAESVPAEEEYQGPAALDPSNTGE